MFLLQVEFSWSFRKNDKIENHVLIDVWNICQKHYFAICNGLQIKSILKYENKCFDKSDKNCIFLHQIAFFLLLSVNHDYMEMLMIRGIGVNIVRQKVGLGNLFWFWLWQIVCCHFSDKLANWSFQAATAAVITTSQLLQNMSQTLNHRKRSA